MVKEGRKEERKEGGKKTRWKKEGRKAYHGDMVKEGMKERRKEGRKAYHGDKVKEGGKEGGREGGKKTR